MQVRKSWGLEFQMASLPLSKQKIAQAAFNPKTGIAAGAIIPTIHYL
jgi:hypothetical protein